MSVYSWVFLVALLSNLFFLSWFRVCQVLYWFVYDIGVQEENDKRYNRRFHERDQHTCVNSGSVDTLRRRNFENASFFSSVRPTVHTNPSRKRSFSKTLFKPEEFTEENFGSSFFVRRKHFESGAFRKRGVMVTIWWPVTVFPQNMNPNDRWLLRNSSDIVWTENSFFRVKPPFSNACVKIHRAYKRIGNVFHRHVLLIPHSGHSLILLPKPRRIKSPPGSLRAPISSRLPWARASFRQEKQHGCQWWRGWTLRNQEFLLHRQLSVLCKRSPEVACKFCSLCYIFHVF